MVEVRTCISFIIDDLEIDFTEHENVIHAFTELMAILQENLPESRLPIVKTRCMAVTHGPFRESIDTQADNVYNFFKLLSKNKLYCNWLNISLLEVIIVALRNKRLKKLVNSYKKEIYSRKLRQVWKHIPHHRKKTKYYNEVTAKFASKNPDNVTVQELIDYSKKLANEIALLFMDVMENCLIVNWLVPTDKVYQLFLSTLTVPQESRQEDFLQIGTWIVHHPQFVLQKLKMEFG